MSASEINEKITDEFLAGLFPPERADEFFEALYGGAETGAFDIALKTNGFNEATSTLMLEFQLTERPGKCMACNLTYGLPQVFERHPIINVSGMMEEIGKVLAPEWKVAGWQIGSTMAVDPKLNTIPLMVKLERA